MTRPAWPWPPITRNRGHPPASAPSIPGLYPSRVTPEAPPRPHYLRKLLNPGTMGAVGAGRGLWGHGQGRRPLPRKQFRPPDPRGQERTPPAPRVPLRSGPRGGRGWAGSGGGASAVIPPPPRLRPSFCSLPSFLASDPHSQAFPSRRSLPLCFSVSIVIIPLPQKLTRGHPPASHCLLAGVSLTPSLLPLTCQHPPASVSASGHRCHPSALSSAQMDMLLPHAVHSWAYPYPCLAM